jgi:hypothetical protein
MIITKDQIERHFKSFFLKNTINEQDSLVVGWGMRLIEDFNIDDLVFLHNEKMSIVETLARTYHVYKKLKATKERKRSLLFTKVANLLVHHYDPYGVINELIYEIEELNEFFTNEDKEYE